MPKTRRSCTCKPSLIRMPVAGTPCRKTDKGREKRLVVEHTMEVVPHKQSPAIKGTNRRKDHSDGDPRLRPGGPA